MITAENAVQKSYVLLQMGDRRFAMPARSVSELAPPVRLHEFPHTSSLVVGVIVRRGRMIPVYDIAPVLTGQSPFTHRFYLVAQRKFGAVSEPSAIPVSGECELAVAELQPRTAADPEYISGSLQINGEDIKALDLEALVTSHTIGANQTSSGVVQL
jgi:chemotaxis signal transduction protein